MEKGWTLIYVNNQLHKTEIVRAVLEDEGIESVSMDKRDSSYISIGDIEVYVHEEDANLARTIIEKNAL
jgi:Putative prokaryotic signal transducing protein